jgi:lipopolysaccharide cholinephosphotransferase
MLTELQVKQLELVDVLDRICKKHNIKYYANGGTLIGCYRHNGFIPHDIDMDFLMTRKNFDKFLKVVDSELEHPYVFNSPYKKNFNFSFVNRILNVETTYFVNKRHTKLSKHLNIAAGVFIDIFVFDNVPEDYDERVEFGNQLNEIKKEINTIQNNYIIKPSDKLLKEYNKYMDAYLNMCVKYKDSNTSVVADTSSLHFKQQAVWFKDWIEGDTNELVQFEDRLLPVPECGRRCLDNLYPRWDEIIEDTHPKKPFVDINNSYLKYNSGELKLKKF